MSDDYLDSEPGIYEDDGAAAALVEQQRQSMREKLRTAPAVSLTIFDGRGDGYHWGVYMRDDGDVESFLLYAASKAVLDVAGALEIDESLACRLILDAIERGLGR